MLSLASAKGQVHLTVDHYDSQPPLVDVYALEKYLQHRGFRTDSQRSRNTNLPVYWLRVTRSAKLAEHARHHAQTRGYRAVAVIRVHAPRRRLHVRKDVLMAELIGDHIDLAVGQDGRRCVRYLIDHFQTSTPLPSLLVVNNSRDLSVAKMTPRLIRYVQEETSLNCIVISTRHSLQRAFERSHLVGVVLSGGPLLLSEKTDLRMYNKNITALLMAERRALPVLGICFGMQIMAASYGGDVRSMKRRVHGIERVHVVEKSRLFGKLMGMRVFSSHQNHVHRPPYGFKVTAVDDDGRIQSIEHDTRHLYGVQFHPEGTCEGCHVLDVFIYACIAHSNRPCLKAFRAPFRGR